MLINHYDTLYKSAMPCYFWELVADMAISHTEYVMRQFPIQSAIQCAKNLCALYTTTPHISLLNHDTFNDITMKSANNDHSHDMIDRLSFIP